MLPLAEGEDGRHGLAGSKTAVVLGVEERVPRVRCAHAHRTGLEAASEARILPSRMPLMMEPTCSPVTWASCPGVMNSGTYSNVWCQTFLLLPLSTNTAPSIPEATYHLVAPTGCDEVKNIMNLLLYDTRIII